MAGRTCDCHQSGGEEDQAKADGKDDERPEYVG